MRTAWTYLLCMVAATAAQAEDRNAIERRVAAEPAGEVNISNVAGEVEVIGWNRNEVEVRGELGRGVERLDVLTEKGRVKVQVVLPRGSSRSGSAYLQVRVPRASRLAVSAVSADVQSDGVLGAQRLKTVSGEITADFAGVLLDIKTVSGDITLRGNGKPAEMHVSSVSGNLDLDEAAGTLDVVSVSGDLRAELGDTGEVRARTTSGNVSVRARLRLDARVDVETVSGEVALRVPSVEGFETEIESFSGDIEGCYEKEVTRTSKYGPGTRLNVSHGKASAQVRVKSLSGDIDFCDR
jgi:DUF4097 and DUF4098 domain-containing protein YvlB